MPLLLKACCCWPAIKQGGSPGSESKHTACEKEDRKVANARTNDSFTFARASTLRAAIRLDPNESNPARRPPALSLARTRALSRTVRAARARSPRFDRSPRDLIPNAPPCHQSRDQERSPPRRRVPLFSSVRSRARPLAGHRARSGSPRSRSSRSYRAASPRRRRRRRGGGAALEIFLHRLLRRPIWGGWASTQMRASTQCTPVYIP